jgi:hypothetical protein
MQQQLQAMQQAQAAPPAAAQPGNQPIAPLAFAQEPAQAQGGLLDYNNRKDIELHKNGSAALPGDAFDGTKLPIWLGKVETRAHSLGMLDILTYDNLLIIKRYADATKAQVRAAVTQYQQARGRSAQNASILFNFLQASITDTILAKVNLSSQDYILEVDGELINDGTCFLKAIIDSLHTNTLFSATAARTALSSLDVYMEKLPEERHKQNE